MLLLTRQRPIFFGWVIVGVLGITTIISYGTMAYAFGVLVVPISSEPGWTRAALSGAYGLGILTAGVLGVPVGRWVDRAGGRLPLSLGSALGGAVFVALSRARAAPEFDLLWGVGLGLASALTFYPVSFTIVANWFPQRRGAALAWLTTIGGLASPIFIPTTGWLVAHRGWRDALLILGLTQLGIALPLHLLVVRRPPKDPGPRLGQREIAEPRSTNAAEAIGVGVGTTLAEALGRRAFWMITLAAGLEQLAAMIVWAHQIPFMISHGFAPVFAAGVAGLLGLVSLPGRFTLNRLSDQYGARPVLVAVLAVHVLAVAVLMLATSATALYLYILAYGVVFGARAPLRALFMVEHFGVRAYGTITAVQGVVVAVPAAFGPFAAGWLYDRLGSYQFAFWLTAASFGIAALLILGTPRPRLAAARDASSQNIGS